MVKTIERWSRDIAPNTIGFTEFGFDSIGRFATDVNGFLSYGINSNYRDFWFVPTVNAFDTSQITFASAWSM